MHPMTENDFTLCNTDLIEDVGGGLFFSSSILDERGDTLFTMNLIKDKMVVTPSNRTEGHECESLLPRFLGILREFDSQLRVISTDETEELEAEEDEDR